MDPGTVLRKTTKGLDEMANRTFRLAQRARGVLIVVDGKLSRAAVLQRTVDPAGSEQLVDELIRDGFIEPVEAPDGPAAHGVRGAGSSTPDLAALRRKAASAVIDALGPDGESLALQIERCRTEDGLGELLDRCHDIVRRVRGATAADRFVQRCGLTG